MRTPGLAACAGTGRSDRSAQDGSSGGKGCRGGAFGDQAGWWAGPLKMQEDGVPPVRGERSTHDDDARRVQAHPRGLDLGPEGSAPACDRLDLASADRGIDPRERRQALPFRVQL